MVVLPISGLRARWRPSNGRDDIALADSVPGLESSLEYAGRAADLEHATNPADLPVGDLDLLVVWRRREQRGDLLVAEGRCSRCDTPVDIRFSLAAYAAHHRPRPTRRAEPLGAGWYALRAGGAVFRLPTVADVIAARDAPDARRDLLRRCLRESVTAATARAVEQVMASLGPTLNATVTGNCPECGASVELAVQARELCLAELRQSAVGVYDDVNLIASAYGWSQDDILDLPSARRRRYADTIAGRAPERLSRELAHA